MARTLISSHQLESVPWAGNTALAHVYDALNDADRAPLTLLVGGCVRNAVLDVPLTDIDLATILTPDEVIMRVEAAGLRAIPTGIDHGTITVVCDGRGFEVTTLRADIATDGRHATIAFTDDWAVDAARRDFTMNALYADLDGRIYDPLKSGLEDARTGRVRFVGDAAARINEDYLRILRFFRFHAFYGRGDMDVAGVAACVDNAPRMYNLSRERVTAEMLKWLGAPDPVPTLRVAQMRGVMQALLPGNVHLDVMERLLTLQRAADRLDVMARLHIVLDSIDPGPVLRLSRKQEGMLTALEQTVLEPERSIASLQRDLYRYGHDIVWQRLFLDLAEVGEDKVPSAVEELRGWTPPVFPVTGNDLIAKGMTPGPALGTRLHEMEEAWLANGFKI